jgi:hypothetical protein
MNQVKIKLLLIAFPFPPHDKCFASVRCSAVINAVQSIYIYFCFPTKLTATRDKNRNSSSKSKLFSPLSIIFHLIVFYDISPGIVVDDIGQNEK